MVQRRLVLINLGLGDWNLVLFCAEFIVIFSFSKQRKDILVKVEMFLLVCFGLKTWLSHLQDDILIKLH